MIEYKDFAALQAKRRQETDGRRGETAVARLEMLARAAVESERLTASEHWNFFLTVLRAAREETEFRIGIYRSTLESRDLWNPEQMTVCKASLLALQERRATLDWIEGVPKQLLEDGRSAEEVLAQWRETAGDAEDDTGPAAA